MEFIRRMFADWNRGVSNPDDLDEAVHWDVRDLPTSPDLRRVYNGRSEVVQFWRDWLPAWSSIKAEIKWIEAVGDRVVVWLDQTMVGRESQIEMRIEYGWDVILREGKVARVAFFADEEKARAAIGLDSA